MTGMTLIEINEQVSHFFKTFNILNLGLVLIWIVGSVFLANAVTEKKDEKLLAILVFLMFGGLIFFAGDPAKYVLLIVAVAVVIYGMFKMLWKKKEEYNG